jgi:hypothetical protein
MTNFSTEELSQYSLLSAELGQVKFDAKSIIHTIYQYSFTLAKLDKEFQHVLCECNVLLPDGVVIIAAV